MLLRVKVTSRERALDVYSATLYCHVRQLIRSAVEQKWKTLGAALLTLVLGVQVAGSGAPRLPDAASARTAQPAVSRGTQPRSPVAERPSCVRPYPLLQLDWQGTHTRVRSSR
ncbi:hypothetical protein [Marinobacter sp.]|uniref:hypothetical protein n=1 Tax=Marinobacter sp. TaxID=50741 RepID=UPI00261C0DA6|nr:hypothetical protein [Marinobacter sp.]